MSVRSGHVIFVTPQGCFFLLLAARGRVPGDIYDKLDNRFRSKHPSVIAVRIERLFP